MRISYIKLHGCLFGSPLPNLQSQCYSTAPSDYEQVSSKNPSTPASHLLLNNLLVRSCLSIGHISKTDHSLLL